MENIRRLMESATPRLRAAQRRYKADFDKRVRPLQRPDVGYMVYSRREAVKREIQTGLKSRHKLQSKLIGPYTVSESRCSTVVIDRDGLL